MKNTRLENPISKGMGEFVFWWGVVGWGVILSAADAVLEFLVYDTPFWDKMFRSFRYTPLTGAIVGFGGWAILNSTYKKQKREDAKVNPAVSTLEKPAG